MITVSVRKLEVVHKQVEGYLIPYNRQLAFVRKLKVILPDACIVTSIALNLKIKTDIVVLPCCVLTIFDNFDAKLLLLFTELATSIDITIVKRYHNFDKFRIYYPILGGISQSS